MTRDAERRLARILLVGLLTWWALAIAATASAQEHLAVRFLDVGQADAVLISHDGRHMLYDAGDVGSGVATRLRALGIDTLDLLVASHPHADHIGGMAAVVDSLVILAYADPGTAHTTLAYSRLMEALIAQPGGVAVMRPDRIGGADLYWLAPPLDSAGWSLNDMSLGVSVTLGDGSVTLGGDAEEAAWGRWLARRELAPTTVHKASHHGSANGDTSEALAILQPELVVIGVGEGNRHDHPRDEALRLYADVGARVLRTDWHGETLVEVTSTGEVRTWTERTPATIYVDPWRLRWPWGTIR